MNSGSGQPSKLLPLEKVFLSGQQPKRLCEQSDFGQPSPSGPSAGETSSGQQPNSVSLQVWGEAQPRTAQFSFLGGKMTWKHIHLWENIVIGRLTFSEGSLSYGESVPAAAELRSAAFLGILLLPLWLPLLALPLLAETKPLLKSDASRPQVIWKTKVLSQCFSCITL